MRVVMLLSLSFPWLGFGGFFAHRPSEIAIRYPSNTPPTTIEKEYIPGATTTNEFQTRLTAKHRTAMFGTFDSYCQHCIFPKLKRHGEDHWDAPKAEELHYKNLVFDDYNWCGDLIYWDYKDHLSRDFYNNFGRLTGIYGFMTNQIYCAPGYYTAVDFQNWGCSKTPGIMLHFEPSGWTTNYMDIVSSNVLANYMIGLKELSFLDIEENGFIWNDGYNVWPDKLEFTGFSGYHPFYDQPSSSEFGSLVNLRFSGTGLTENRINDVLAEVAAGNSFTNVPLNASDRVWWRSFAWPNAILAAADLYYAPLNYSDNGPWALMRMKEIRGSESTGVRMGEISTRLLMINGKITGFEDEINQLKGDIITEGAAYATNTCITPYASAGTDLNANGNITMYGSFFERLNSGSILDLAKNIPSSNYVYHAVNMLYINDPAGPRVVLYFTDNIPGEKTLPLSLSGSKQCIIDYIGGSVRLAGRLWFPEVIIPYMDSCPETAHWPWDRSYRSRYPHPVCQSLIDSLHLTEVSDLLTSTNAEVVASFYLSEASSGWSYSSTSFDICEFRSHLSRLTEIARIDDFAVDCARERMNKVYDKVVGLFGHSLRNTASFSGTLSSAAFLEYANHHILGSEEEIPVTLSGAGQLSIRRVGEGNTLDDFEIQSGDYTGVIKDLDTGIRFEFSKTVSVVNKPYHPVASESNSTLRNLIIKWDFPAMKYHDED